MKEQTTDILIIGAGLGGCAAALAVLQMGQRVIMTEETDWIGGQLTAQAVPPDEHPWIETTGCTQTYRRLREGIRDYYRRYYPLRPEIRDNVHLNPGNGGVSRLCHEPRVALAVLQAFFAPYLSSGQLTLLLHNRPIAAETDGDRVEAITVEHTLTGEQHVLRAPYILDATELGDLLELAQVEHIIGSESQADTGELHALSREADPLDQQAITWCFALDYHPGEDHTIDKPEDYAFWLNHRSDFWPGSQLSWTDINPHNLNVRTVPIFTRDPRGKLSRGSRWLYRRILAADYHRPGAFPSDITVINWPQNDYWLGPLVGVSEAERQRHLLGAQQLSYALLYWMQTEAPRHDGGAGYPGLRLRGDVVGTAHGLAKSVYVRESRRIQAEFRILEEHVGVAQRGDLIGAEVFDDSVGLASYRIDLHPSTAGRTYVDISSWPAQIPLGALIPVRIENLLPANKNLGTTHITNGCYRLHPIEWNIGEAAGALAAFCVQHQLTPRQVRNTADHLRAFQRLLFNQLGIPLEWSAYTRRTRRDESEHMLDLHLRLAEE